MLRRTLVQWPSKSAGSTFNSARLCLKPEAFSLSSSKTHLNRPRTAGRQAWRSCGIETWQVEIGRFRGQSTNSPSLWPALRVLHFAAQRNCDLTPKNQTAPENHPSGWTLDAHPSR
jgi:hypothetical protein